MNLDIAEQARVLRLLQMVKISAEEAIKGLTFGLLHIENSQRPHVLTNPNQPDPRQVAQQAAQGALQSFVQHVNQVVMFAAQIPPKAAAAAAEQAEAETGDGELQPLDKKQPNAPRLVID